MDGYCKHIIDKYSQGESIIEICSRPGMPSINTFKKWLFNKECAHEYAGLREQYLQIQKLQFIQHSHELVTLADNLPFAYTKSGTQILDRKKYKEYRDYFKAIIWFEKHITLLEKLYAAHAKGKDLLIKGIHFDEILKSGENLKSFKKERSCSPLLGRGVGGEVSFRIYSDLIRSEAEAILGTPLLYGRISRPTKKQKSKPKPIPDFITSSEASPDCPKSPYSPSGPDSYDLILKSSNKINVDQSNQYYQCLSPQLASPINDSS